MPEAVQRWPAPMHHGGLSAVPPLDRAWELAESLLQRLDADDPEAPARHLGIEVRIAPIGAAVGRHQAMLIPRCGGRFVILCDSDPTPKESLAFKRLFGHQDITAWRDLLHRFRVAHEVAHTLFFTRRGDFPERLCRKSAREEVFCDALALAFVGVRLPELLRVPLNTERRTEILVNLVT